MTRPIWMLTAVLLASTAAARAGDDDHRSVSQSLIEPFVNYNLDNGWYLISDSVITVDWKIKSGDKMTLPLGGGVGKIFKIGSQAMNAQVHYYYNVEKPDLVGDSNIRLQLQFMFPR